MDKYNIKSTLDYLNQFESKIQYVAVGHTHFHTLKLTEFEIACRMADAKKACRFFRRKFSQFLYGKRAVKKGQEIYTPLIISHLEYKSNSKNSNPNYTPLTISQSQSFTMHYHFSFGNIPQCLTEDEVKMVFEHCWVNMAHQSSKSLWLQSARANNSNWLNYSIKEKYKGNDSAWDFENTQIPFMALN
jgi:hypothetical protein